ncbi:MAG: hypothetical protein RJA07_1436 [Bacteroidota bacterium]
MGSKPIGYNCLAHLIANQQKLNYTIIGVLSNDNIGFRKMPFLAVEDNKDEMEMASKHFSKKSIAKPNINQSVLQLAKHNKIKIISSLDAMPNCDIIYSVQYHQILQQQHIDKASQIALNLHMAPLPDYRGCNQFSFAIIDKAKEFGTTIHQLASGIDNGDIVFEDRFKIPENCFVKDLYDETEHRSIRLFKTSLPNIIKGNYTLLPQNSFTKRKKNFHLRHEINDIKQIDLAWSKQKIKRYIRASYFPPFEPPYCIINGNKFYFKPQ